MFTESFLEDYIGDSAVLERGRAYAAKVQEFEVGENDEIEQYSTEFSGIKTHNTSLTVNKEDGSLVETECTCSEDGKCAHAAALALSMLTMYRNGDLTVAGEEYSASDEGEIHNSYEIHFFLEKEDVDENSFLTASIKLSVGEGQQKIYCDISPYFMELLRSKGSLGGGYGTLQPTEKLDLMDSEEGDVLDFGEGHFLLWNDEIGEQLMESLFSAEDLTRAALFIDAREPKLIFPFGSPHLIQFLQTLEKGTNEGEWIVHHGQKVIDLNFNKDELAIFARVEMKEDTFYSTFSFKLGHRDVSAYEFEYIFQCFYKYIEFDEGEYIEVLNKKEAHILYQFLLNHEGFIDEDDDIFKIETKLWHLPEMMFLLEAVGGSVDGDDHFVKCWKQMQDRSSDTKFTCKDDIEKLLRPYQKEGVVWGHFLRDFYFGGILADDMGLGKTLQVLTLIDVVKPKYSSLIVAPKTLIHNWKNEIEKFYPGKTYMVIDGSVKERKDMLTEAEKKKPDFLLTSYGTLLKDIGHYDKFVEPFEYVILDEAHYIKNHKTKIANSVKRLHSNFRLAITGTPLENSVTDLWSLFDFLMPGFLGDSSDFKRKFETPIMKKGDGRTLEMLSAKIRPFMLRRTKDLVMKELPPKIEQTIYCDLSAEQTKLYIDICKKAKGEVEQVLERKGFARSRIEILAALNRMRQVCNHPAMLDLNHREMESAKFEALFPLLEEAIQEGRKVLLFSSFVKTLKLLEEECKSRKIEYAYLDGQTKYREKAIRKFTDDPKTQVFLVSMKVGGVGLNLTVSDMVVLFDPWWNPTVEMQAVDRAHRMGQKNTVNVYSFVTKGTLEEKICQLKDNKKALFDSAVGETDGVIKNLNWEDMKDLFEWDEIKPKKK